MKKFGIWNTHGRFWMSRDKKKMVFDDVNDVLDTYNELKGKGYKAIEVKVLEDECAGKSKATA